MNHIEKEYLLTPGPTAIPARVALAMDIRKLHHRTDLFKGYFKKALSALQWLADSETPPIFLACSGTGAMEAALLNCFQRSDTILVLNAGAFGERWTKIAKKIGLNVIEIKVPWGETLSLEQLKQILQDNPKIKGFCMQHSETSTCVLHPIQEIIKTTRSINPEITIIVDAISSIATTKLSVKEFDIDILVVASQKALMLPPGLSSLLINERTWKLIEKNNPSSFYFDLLAERKSHAQATTAWTPATTLIVGLSEAIEMIREEGLDNVINRHSLLAEACRSAVKALGFKLLSNSHPTSAVTGFFPDHGIDANALRKEILNSSAVRFAGGQGDIKDTLIRIGHMGYVNQLDLIAGLSALELALTKFMPNFEIGKGVKAALSVLAVR